jgi:hypothetical protein
MYIKIHKDGSHKVLAICDENLIGKTFDDGKVYIEVSARFYKGEIKSDEEVVKLMKVADNVNMIGKKCMKLALDNGIIDKESIIIIKGVPYAQVLSL